MYKLRLYAVLPVVIAAASLPQQTSAQSDVCRAVLETRAFNTYDITTHSAARKKVFAELCTSEWLSEQDFVERSQNAGFSYQSFQEAYGFTSSSGGRRNSAREYYRDFCHTKSSDLHVEFFSRQKIQIADVAVKAWETCIQNTPRVGLWGASTVNQTGTSVIIKINFRTETRDPAPLVLRNVAGDRIKCRLGERSIDNLDVRREGFNPASFSIDCSKQSRESVSFTINTNQDTLGPFKVAGLSEIEANALKRDMDRLRSDLEAMKQAPEKGRIFVHEGDVRPSQQRDGYTAHCPPESEAISGYCGIASGKDDCRHGSVSIQNFGISKDKKNWHCLWTGAVPCPTVFAVCMSLPKNKQ